MEIKFIRTPENNIKLGKATWNIYAKKQLPLILFIFLAGILFFFSKETINHNSVVCGPMKCAGVVFIAIGLLRLSDFYRQKTRYLKPLGINKTEIIITENDIVVNEATFQVNYKWDFFKFYLERIDHIALHKDNSSFSGFKISKSEISTDELNSLLAFLTTKLYKK